jgi:hypothetical protein
MVPVNKLSNKDRPAVETKQNKSAMIHSKTRSATGTRFETISNAEFFLLTQTCQQAQLLGNCTCKTNKTNQRKSMKIAMKWSGTAPGIQTVPAKTQNDFVLYIPNKSFDPISNSSKDRSRPKCGGMVEAILLSKNDKCAVAFVQMVIGGKGESHQMLHTFFQFVRKMELLDLLNVVNKPIFENKLPLKELADRSKWSILETTNNNCFVRHQVRIDITPQR